MSMENLLTPAGIEPATFRFVAQHLTTVLPRSPSIIYIYIYIYICVCVCVCVMHMVILSVVVLSLRSKILFSSHNNVQDSSPITGLEWPRGFQEVKVPRFCYNGPGCW